MEIRLVQIGTVPAVQLAVSELGKYIPMLDPSATITISSGEGFLETDSGIQIGVTEGIGDDAGPLADSLEDEIWIEVQNGEGKIIGSNPRSVLIAAYRFLREAGCSWVRPGVSGERVRPRRMDNFALSLREKGAYHHRGVCIEGMCSYEHVLQMIEWMPKVGLNAYFLQFFTPYTFFDKWYSHRTNPFMEPRHISVEEVQEMVEKLTAAMEERGLMHHHVGHGWTCEPFGIPGLGWDVQSYELTEEQQEAFALVNGKREIWKGISLNTNLCYSNNKVRKHLVEAVVSYAKENPRVNYIHLWLADEANNHCECEGCKNTLPADFYVQLLNEIDARMTEEKLSTRIVFLVYLDLLWAPAVQRIASQDRFVLMFAPISRTYSNTFLGACQGRAGQMVPFVRNQNKMPTKLEDNAAYLKSWQEQFEGDSFIYDYHLLWDWNNDPGHFITGKVLFEDMRDLDQIGLHGMVSCQMQRVAFPTALGLVSMAEALWNPKQTFEQVAEKYLNDMFEEDGDAVREYLQRMSEMSYPNYLRLEEPEVNPERAEDFAGLRKYIVDKMEWLEEKVNAADNECNRRSWCILRCHAEIWSRMAALLENKAKGNREEALSQWNDLVFMANHMEKDLHDVWDVGFFIETVGKAVQGMLRPGIEF